MNVLKLSSSFPYLPSAYSPRTLVPVPKQPQGRSSPFEPWCITISEYITWNYEVLGQASFGVNSSRILPQPQPGNTVRPSPDEVFQFAQSVY